MTNIAVPGLDTFAEKYAKKAIEESLVGR